MKRFYTAAAAVPIDGGWSIALDGKPVRTPARATLVLPTAALAEAVVGEWAAQGDRVQPATMPLTGLSNAAIDRIAPEHAAFAASLAAYAATDLIAYRAEGPAPLVARQSELWDPLLAWLARRYDVALVPTTAIAHQPQPPATLARIGAAYAAFDAFRLAALSQVVTITGSAVIGLAFADGFIEPDAAFAAGELDELWQAEQWGADPLAEKPQAARRAALVGAWALLRLL